MLIRSVYYILYYCKQQVVCVIKKRDDRIAGQFNDQEAK